MDEENRAVVHLLNGSRFPYQFSLVDFDELTPAELCEITQQVILAIQDSEMDGSDSKRVENPVDRKRYQHGLGKEKGLSKERILSVLQILKYPFHSYPSGADGFQDDLFAEPHLTESKEAGDRRGQKPMKRLWISVLYFLLTNLDKHETRLYLSKYLVGVSVPNEFAFDEGCQMWNEKLRHLQQRFKGVHRQTTSLQTENTRLAPKQLKKDVTSLAKERTQLVEKIERFKKKAGDLDQNDAYHCVGRFEDILEATSKLRECQEENRKLLDKKDELHYLVERTKVLALSKDQELGELKKLISSEATVESKHEISVARTILHWIEKKVRFLHSQETEVSAKLSAYKETLVGLQTKLRHPLKTKDDCDRIEASIHQLDRVLKRSSEEVDSNLKSNAKVAVQLKMFRQQTNLLTKTLKSKQVELDQLLDAKHQLESKISSSNAAVSELQRDTSSPFMSKDDFRAYAQVLRQKTAQFKAKKKELDELTSELFILTRTEGKLKEKCADVEQVEQKVQTSEFESTETQHFTGEDTTEALSRNLRSTVLAISELRMSLQPEVEEVKMLRDQYKRVGTEHHERKIVYDNIAVGLENQQAELLRECTLSESAWTGAQREYQLLHTRLEFIRNRQHMIDCEGRFRGQDRLNRDFKNYKALYQNKLGQLDQLNKALRKTDRELQEHNKDDVKQMNQFTDLRYLLELKLATVGGQQESHPEYTTTAQGANILAFTN